MRASPLPLSLFAAALCLACSSSGPGEQSQNLPAGGSGGGGTSSVVPGGGGGAGPAASGGTSSAGTASATAGTSPAAGGSGGTATAGGTGGSGGGPSEEVPSNFTCTQVIGAMITGEWYNGGDFEPKLMAKGGDPNKWEIKNEHYGTIEKWVNPTEEAHENDHLYWGHAVGSACAMNSNNPDRVIFTAISWELTEEAQWKTALEAVVANIKAKYSNIRWIELVSQMRCPNNMMCNENAVQGPGSDAQASLQDCYVWPAQDAAMAAVAAADPIVGLAPKFEAATCRPEGIDGAHLGSANSGVAQAVADHYATHP